MAASRKRLNFLQQARAIACPKTDIYVSHRSATCLGHLTLPLHSQHLLRPSTFIIGQSRAPKQIPSTRPLDPQSPSPAASDNVHRLVIVDEEDKVIGIISLSDLLYFLVLKPS
ncbi:hypothetical protein TSAR_007918, partial [Trichomalopsis sarcophagae]